MAEVKRELFRAKRSLKNEQISKPKFEPRFADEYIFLFEKTPDEARLAVTEATGFSLPLCSLVLQYAEFLPWNLYLGRLAQKRRLWKDAFKHYSEEAKTGNAAALCLLAHIHIYNYGLHKHPDWNQAEELLKKALDQEPVQATVQLCLLRLHRLGTATASLARKEIETTMRNLAPRSFLAKVWIAYHDKARGAIKKLMPEIEFRVDDENDRDLAIIVEQHSDDKDIVQRFLHDGHIRQNALEVQLWSEIPFEVSSCEFRDTLEETWPRYNSNHSKINDMMQWHLDQGYLPALIRHGKPPYKHATAQLESHLLMSLDRALRQGAGEAYYHKALFYEVSGKEPDNTTICGLYEAAVENGYTDALLAVGDCYRFGTGGVSKDIHKAMLACHRALLLRIHGAEAQVTALAQQTGVQFDLQELEQARLQLGSNNPRPVRVASQPNGQTHHIYDRKV